MVIKCRSSVVGLVVLLLGVVTCFQQGIIFEGGDDVLLTDSHWRISLQYNLTQLQEECQNLSMVLVEVRTHFEGFFQNLLNESISHHSPLVRLERSFRYEYSVLQDAVYDYIEKVGDLLTLLPRKREKRGLINAGGSLIKFLFGNPDNNDMEEMDSKMRYMYDTTKDLVHDNQDHVTVLANMESELISHTKNINKIVSVLKVYHKVMHDNMVKVYTRDRVTQTQLKNLFEYLKLNSALFDTKDAVSKATQRLARLHEAVQDLAEGKVSSNLLSPHDYVSILGEVEKVLLPPAKLFIPVSLESVHRYYSVATVQSYTTDHALRVVIRLPLRNDDQIYESYDVIAYPIFDPTIKRWTQWEVSNNKLLISRDRLMYSVYEEPKFREECKIGALTVCPLGGVIMSVHKRPSCAVELFVKEETKNCNRKLIAGLESPLLTRTRSRWIFSTSGPHRVTLNCYEPSGQLNVTTMLIDGVGDLLNTEKCDIITEGFKIPARIHGNSMFVREITKIKFPEVKSVLSSEENLLLSSDLNETFAVLQGLDEELGTLGVREYRLEGVLHRLRTRSFLSRRGSLETLTWSCLLVFLVLILGYVSCRKRELIIACYTTWRARRRARRYAALLRVMEGLAKSTPAPRMPEESDPGTSRVAETELAIPERRPKGSTNTAEVPLSSGRLSFVQILANQRHVRTTDDRTASGVPN